MIDDTEDISDSNGSYVQPDSNDYLTPYQPTDEDSNSNNSTDNKTESLTSSGENNPTTKYRESTSSSSDVQEGNSGYIKPYQPLLHLADVHENSSTPRDDDSGSSGSDNRESTYLNPYQPMMPVKDLHEYKSIAACSDGPGSSLSETCTKEKGVRFTHFYQDLNSEFNTYEHKPINDISCDTKNLDMRNDDSVEYSQVKDKEKN
ncbi:unnamed protein product [Mytilus coruscus]|uniref:Uncharacterized protein n=1 Tax=Mytilus coruscus TaxID=42192 RepID=A0A6J7ZVM8_MYTCO|nr:unnamed protein product [Mytilus coruscus]